MAKNRVMLFGAAGQVGQTFRHVFDTLPTPPLWEMGYFSREQVDMTNPAALRFAVQNFEPELIINAAALTSVEAAEKDEQAATNINFHAVANLAALACAQDVPIIHLSTDFVFDGQKSENYLTDDQMNPLNNYGASKMMGEEALRYAMPWHVILRISEVFSAFSKNRLLRTLAMLETQEELRMVTDRISGPTPAIDLVHALMTIGEKILDGKVDGYGTFHFCGAPSCSLHELTESIMEAYAPFTSRRPSILPAVSADFPEDITRPVFSVLDCDKIKSVYSIDQPSWKEGLQKAISHLHENNLLSGKK